MEFTLPLVGLQVSVFVILLGFLVGVFSSMFGVGGGFIAVPALTLVFGIEPAIAAGSSLSQMVFTTLSGVIGHVRHRNVEWKVALVFVAGALVGVELGAGWIDALTAGAKPVSIFGHPTEAAMFYQLLGLTSIFLCLGGFILYETLFIPRTPAGEPGRRFERPLRIVKIRPMISSERGEYAPFSGMLLALVGAMGGVVAGFLGIGGGFIAVPMFLYFVGLSTRRSVGTSLFVVFCIALWGMYRHEAAGRGNVDFGIVASVVIGSVGGAFLGAWLTSILKAVSIRKYFAVAILVTCAAVWILFFCKLLL
ncbi:MAG: sulfite exporter TauE/SafE family protein [Candidatus Brocadiia bacterium]